MDRQDHLSDNGTSGSRRPLRFPSKALFKRRGNSLSTEPCQAGTACDLVSAFPVLLSGQRFNGVELRGLSGRKIAKHNPRQKSTREGDDDRYDSEDYAPTRDRGGC